MNNEQSKAWSDALKRAARLIQEHYGISRSLTREETIAAIKALNAKIPKTASDQKLLTELEATE